MNNDFYYTYVCVKCCENRDNSTLSQIIPPICKVCGDKVIAVKIYVRMLDGFKKGPVDEAVNLAIHNIRAGIEWNAEHPYSFEMIKAELTCLENKLNDR